MPLKTLDEFLKTSFGNAYVREAGFSSLYVRHASRYLEGRRIPVLDIANVTAAKPGKGAFTALVARLLVQGVSLYVENVHNARFAKKLLVLGFLGAPHDPISYYKLAPEPVNRNISETLSKEQNEAQEKAQAKKKLKRAKERADRMRAERKGGKQ